MFPTSVLTTICLLGGLFCFVPLIAGPLNDFSASKLPGGLQSQRSRDLAVASVTFATPIFFGILIDTIPFFFMRVKSKKIRPHVGQELLNTQERLALTSAILVVAIPSLLQIDIPNLANVWMCLRNCRLTLMGGIINISLCRYDKNFWTVSKTCLSLILLASASVIGACAINLRSLDGSPAATVVASLILLLGVGNFLSCSIKWLLSVFPRIYRRVVQVWYTKTDAVLEDSRTCECCKHLLFPLLYVTSISVASVVLIPSIAIHPSLHSIEDYLFLDSVGIIAFLLFIMYISDRMTKVDVIEGLYNLIESKKTYVRYISHELRTPLNSACVGLQLVCDELGKSGGIGVSEHRETLLDVQTACRIAVEILNDLLCFDKLESGILELHKHEVPVNSFISDCVNMFGSQAREAGVTIINNSLMKTDPGASDGWLDSDTVLMDKFKMDQVLRNLISNALKFTTRGGCVSVCASFVADDATQSVVGSNGRRSTVCEFGDNQDVSSDAPHDWSCLHVWNTFFSRGQVALDASSDVELGMCFGQETKKKKMTTSSWFKPRIGWTQNVLAGDTDVVARNDYNTDMAALHDCMQVDFSTTVTSGRLRIVVTDTGAGISQENQARLFKEIVQFNPEVLQAGGGSGLGLYITSSIVQMHGGTICAYSAGAGSGSTFTVEIDMQLRRSHSSSSLRSKTPFDITINPGLRSPSSRRQPTRSYKEDQHHLEDISITTTPNLKARSQLPSPMPSPQQSATHHPTSAHCSPTLQPVAPRNALNGQAWCDLRELHAPLSLVIDYSRANEYPTSPSTLAPTEDINQLRGADREVVYDILVVDDSSLNRKMLCRLLRTAGYICEEANDGQCAVEKVKVRMENGGGGGGGSKGYYDAILMDFVMPIMDGPTATQAIRGLRYSYPIFGVTGNALDSDINYFVKSGANAVLTKPFDFDRFKRLMKENCQHASL